jgi:hypothetical protein
MAQQLPDDLRGPCVLCGQDPGEPGLLDRSADSGPMLLAVHSDGVACGNIAHDTCVRRVRARGPLDYVDCPCGRGSVVEGIAPPSSWRPESDATPPAARADGEDAEPVRTTGHGL